MKVLILSCNTGQGHNTAGKAILAELEVLEQFTPYIKKVLIGNTVPMQKKCQQSLKTKPLKLPPIIETSSFPYLMK